MPIDLRIFLWCRRQKIWTIALNNVSFFWRVIQIAEGRKQIQVENAKLMMSFSIFEYWLFPPKNPVLFDKQKD